MGATHMASLHLPSPNPSTISQEADSKQTPSSPSPSLDLHGTATCQLCFSPAKHVVLSLWCFLRVVEAAVTTACQNAQKVKKDIECWPGQTESKWVCLPRSDVDWGPLGSVCIKQANQNPSFKKQRWIEKPFVVNWTPSSTLSCLFSSHH